MGHFANETPRFFTQVTSKHATPKKYEFLHNGRAWRTVRFTLLAVYIMAISPLKRTATKYVQYLSKEHVSFLTRTVRQ